MEENRVLQFGSEEMKSYLLRAYSFPEERNNVLRMLFDSVKMYTLYKIGTGFKAGEVPTKRKGGKCSPLCTSNISRQEYDDIVAEVYRRVLDVLDGFINNLRENKYSLKQRQAWLRTIIYYACLEYLKKQNELQYSIDEDESAFDQISYRISFEENSAEEMAEEKDTVQKLIRRICLSGSKPEKLLAYIFNVLVFKEHENRLYNSSAIHTSKYMNGKILFVLKCNMVSEVRKIYEVILQASTIKSLNKSLGEETATKKGEEVCCVTPKQITDWTNRIKTYIFKYRFEIFGEDVDNYVSKKRTSVR